jgi:hypothetical protein
MAGLVPAIHVFVSGTELKTWMPAAGVSAGEFAGFDFRGRLRLNSLGD